MIKTKPNNVYECIYIHAGKVRTKEGWALIINSMDAASEFAFPPVFNETTKIEIVVLNHLFDNIFKNYKPNSHPQQINFITNLPPDYSQLFHQTKAGHHRFIHDKEATLRAMNCLISNFSIEIVDL